MTLRFEWDPKKAETNLRKHGVSFEAAVRVFYDPYVLYMQDRVEEGELRWHAIGRIDAFTVLFVAHSQIDEDGAEVIRIISARKADRTERRRYDNEITKHYPLRN